MPGPQPQPAALKVLRGNPGQRAIPKEPKVDRIFPPMPAGMPTEAQKVWRKVEKGYAQAGVVATIDGETLRIYCLTFAKWLDATTRLQHEDLVTPTYRMDKDGNPVLISYVRNPLDIVARDTAQTFRMYARELGLTPASRVGLGRTEEEPGDPLDAWQAAK